MPVKIHFWSLLTPEQKIRLLQRPALASAACCQKRVREIITRVENEGDNALFSLTKALDKISAPIVVSKQEIDEAENYLSQSFKQAVDIAYANISRFHQAQQKAPLQVETMSGVVCELVSRPIESVGLYIPGGSAPLPSTVLMLAVPAKIAGCRDIVLCSPPPIAKEVLYIAKKCGVHEIYNLGGAQAIAAMALGTKTVKKVDKIFGPGNAYVTEAKKQVTQKMHGVAIDMPAGPSEVLIIADSKANPAFIAADLLSQAEHGADSQVVLVTDSEQIATQVEKEIERQLALLTRVTIATQSLAASMIIIADDLQQCLDISNLYAPEHLIIQTQNARELLPFIHHAGSVFLGAWSPESVGDYASGTNHVLPTYGYTKAYSSLSLADFCKNMTVQELSSAGLLEIAPTVIELANAEGLDAHKNAVAIRLKQINASGEK